ncbi:hypothetical protein ABZ318_34025 [Streptomyces sp. NPDC006197]|uniref:hypothetical protein n=1 Tax=Streptomyces sp. NPDC006197 TaxID=3156685 RepID=UPI0033BD3325
MDAAVKEAAVDRFLRDHPRAGLSGCDHPALLGCADAAWPQTSGGPSRIPALLPYLLDEATGTEALRLLDNALLEDVFHVSAAMPAAVPFLLRLAADPHLAIAVRTGLVDLLALAAHLSEPVDADDERSVLMLGLDDDHPERERCRAAFLAHAPALAGLLDDETLPDGLLSAEDRECLRTAGALR